MSLNPASERADFLSLLPRLTSFSEQGVSAPMGHTGGKDTWDQ